MFNAYKNRPRIGITAPIRGNRLALSCLKLAVRLAGGRPIVLRPGVSIEKIEASQGFILAGGSDINPSEYNGYHAHIRLYDFERDHLERHVVQHAFDRKLPILGICRGMQMLAVALGGTLYQDLSDAIPGFKASRSLVAKIFGRRNVTVEPMTKLSDAFAMAPMLRVNSIHRQGVARVPAALRVVATGEHGDPQALEAVDPFHFAVGVQWHPEFMLGHSEQIALFRKLVEEASAPPVPSSFEPALSRITS